MTTTSATVTEPVSLTQKKTLHTVVFDVSGSMKGPLKLRDTARNANMKSSKLDPKRVQTVFDLICSLAEDGIVSASDRGIDVAVLCFGLRVVDTCDLLALLEKRTKIVELQGVAKAQSTSELRYSEAIALLGAVSIPESEVQEYIKRVPRQNEPNTSNDEILYTVVGHEPLIRLLADAGAPFCEKYVKDHLTAVSAGRYFVVLADPDRAVDLNALVTQLPDACKNERNLTRVASNLTPVIGSAIEGSATSEAIQLADALIANNVTAFLNSIPTATPRPLHNVIQLVRRLQSALKRLEGRGSTDGVSGTSPEQFPTIETHTASINWEGLLNDIERYLYGGTPMCCALRSIQPVFEDQTYASKVMILISDGEATDGRPGPLAKALRDAGGIIFACLFTDKSIEEPRRLRGADELDKKWSRAARRMFKMASTVSYTSAPVQALRRRGWTLPAFGQCKLFIQANNPTIIDEFASASRSLSTSSDALADLIGEISLDVYVQTSNDGAKATDQEGRPICWAHATATVIHLASQRVVGRTIPEFSGLRSRLLSMFGDNDDGQSVGRVLDKICPSHRLRYQRCDETGARAAIYARRPVIVTFSLDDKRWERFSSFYKSTPKGTLTTRDLNGPGGGDLAGHAVVLVRCGEASLTFMNSWGPSFANNGFFTVDKASTLEIPGRTRTRFYDVYWTTDDLSSEEIAKWKDHEMQTVRTFISALPKRFHDLPVACPHCKISALACNYDGTWNEACCRACKRTFSPTVRALLQSLYDSNYDST